MMTPEASRRDRIARMLDDVTGPEAKPSATITLSGYARSRHFVELLSDEMADRCFDPMLSRDNYLGTAMAWLAHEAEHEAAVRLIGGKVLSYHLTLINNPRVEGPLFTTAIKWIKKPRSQFDVAYVCLYPREPSEEDKLIAGRASYPSVETIVSNLIVRNPLFPVQLPMPLSVQGRPEPKIAG